ncbi:GspH/FimT family pseudopilin [Lysobacter sp. N42]|uniref:GspH/FimT family pseudopilin n=1 Tax=Lysobacter sp. N42 TaxID=2545719 RepID=UPI0010481A68|nr:GspH/FimT family pseudopilin [Lysobacter sp. N42]TCZ88703.1 prepilin-type N-terminal cleavage/methylation domain-containing protein [Lysobacter sp. N42]
MRGVRDGHGKARRRRGSGGFTLVELMVVIAVLALLVGIGVPAFNGVIQRNRLAAAANEVVSALQTARMEAVRRNRRAVLCPTANGETCSGTNWGRLLIFIDDDLSGNVSGDELVIRSADIVRPGSGVVASSAAGRIWFGSDGRVSVGAADTARISLVAASLPAASSGRLVEAAVSRISVCETAGASTTCNR